jgi:hypothetical protein
VALVVAAVLVAAVLVAAVLVVLVLVVPVLQGASGLLAVSAGLAVSAEAGV